MAKRTAFHEVQLIIMRLLSVFMSRTKSGTKTASEVRLFANRHLTSMHGKNVELGNLISGKCCVWRGIIHDFEVELIILK